MLGFLLGGSGGVLSAYAARVEIRPTEGTITSDLLSDLQSKLTDEKSPETAFEAKRQARRASDTLSNALNAKGYYDPTIEMLIETSDGVKPVVIVSPGKQFHIAGIEIAFEDPVPRNEDQSRAHKSLTLSTGKVAIPADVIDGEREIVSALRDSGYAFAEAQDRAVIGDRDAAELEITYNIRSGNRIRFGKVIYPENIRTKVSYLRRLEAFDEGELYDPSKLALFASRLDETRLYTIANARLSPVATSMSNDGDAIHDIIVTLKERDRNTVALGASLATDTGFGLSGEFTRRNLSRRGDMLIAQANFAELEQSLDLQWRRPNEFGYGRGLILSSALSNEETDAFDRQSFSLGAGFEVAEGPRFSYGYGVVGSVVKEQDDFGERDLQILSVYGTARLDRADDVLNPKRGWRADVRVEPSVSFGGEQSQFVQSSAQLRGYLPFGPQRRVVLAGRVKAGTVWGAGVSELPSQMRYFAGGGGSVRGYGYQAIGPRSDDNDPLGGRSLLETSVEARWQLRNKLGVAAFIDGGSVTSRETPGFGDLRFGTGIGVRYDTPAGPLRIDIATPLDKTDNDDPVQIYIALGQAF